MLPTIEAAMHLAEAGKHDEAWPIVLEELGKDPDDPHALTLASFILERDGRSALALPLARRLTEKYSKTATGWINYGRCLDNLWRMDEALKAYDSGWKCANTHEDKLALLANIGAVHLQLGEFVKARQYAERALKLEPEHRKSQHNLGLCQMAAHEWRAGWINYRGSLGSKHRLDWRYGEEPEWDGSPGKTVAICGEQGIGDEICAASMFDEACDISKKVIIDCDIRLANLFRRSFRNARVYGTRHKKELDWHKDDCEIDASISSFQLGQFFRNETKDFPRAPYLIADPERVLMWQALWAAKGKPSIGIAWSGGLKETGAHVRRWTLEELLPVFRSVDAHWVCLQYKNAQPEISEFRRKHPEVDLVQYPYATLGRDYDDTAALVASLDSVVGVPTSVVHLSGALGIKTVVSKSRFSCWKFAAGCPFQPLTLVPWDTEAMADQLKAWH